MKILCLYNNKCALELFEWLERQENECILWNKELEAGWCREQGFHLTISYTYSFILKEDVIAALNNNVVNLHNSYLPFDRGASPNLWNILEGSPRGVSIHYVNAELDKGDLIAQQLVPLKLNTTLKSSYEQLDTAVKELFKELFPNYTYWESMRKVCRGRGSYHRENDFKRIKDSLGELDWDMPVLEFIEKTRNLIME